MNSLYEPNEPNQAASDAEKTSEVTEPVKPRRPRGFAAMDRNRVSEIARKGGKAAHAAGTAHQFTTDEARAAGRKGGVAPHVRRGRGPRKGASGPQSTSTPSESNEDAR